MTTTTTRTTGGTAATRVPMDAMRKTALIAGGFYLVTFLAGIPPTFLLYTDVLNEPAFILGSGSDTAVLWGGLLEFINAAACIGTAVALFPVVKRQSEAAALGFVTARVIEAAIIIVGVISLFSILTLRQDLAGATGAEAASLVVAGHALVGTYEWTALAGPGLIPALNALTLGYALYRSGLVPRAIPLMGLIGAPLLVASFTASLFGFTEQFSVTAAIGALPIALWELSLGIYLLVKGFRPSPLTAVPAV